MQKRLKEGERVREKEESPIGSRSSSLTPRESLEHQSAEEQSECPRPGLEPKKRRAKHYRGTVIWRKQEKEKKGARTDQKPTSKYGRGAKKQTGKYRRLWFGWLVAKTIMVCILFKNCGSKQKVKDVPCVPTLREVSGSKPGIWKAEQVGHVQQWKKKPKLGRARLLRTDRFERGVFRTVSCKTLIKRSIAWSLSEESPSLNRTPKFGARLRTGGGEWGKSFSRKSSVKKKGSSPCAKLRELLLGSLA